MEQNNITTMPEQNAKVEKKEKKKGWFRRMSTKGKICTIAGGATLVLGGGTVLFLILKGKPNAAAKVAEKVAEAAPEVAETVVEAVV